MGSFGPYGKEEGIPFELPAISGEIIGFHGRSGSLLDALGIYVKVCKSYYLSLIFGSSDQISKLNGHSKCFKRKCLNVYICLIEINIYHKLAFLWPKHFVTEPLYNIMLTFFGEIGQ